MASRHEFTDQLAEWLAPGGTLDGTCVGRVHLPAALCPKRIGGPTLVAIRREGVFDLIAAGPTMADLLDRNDRIAQAQRPDLRWLASLEDVLAASHYLARGDDKVHLLAPFDLQVIKACGVTFIGSLMERVVEEKSQGKPERAREIRAQVDNLVGSTLRDIDPGSDRAKQVKGRLIAAGLWSQYLEVAIGPDAEIFTKTPVLSSVGFGERVGVRRDSTWNNLEPEVVLAVNARNEAVGASLGNDVTLRDYEGRSALLLGEAKDANASSSLGPWIRLFDEDAFSLATLLDSEVRFMVEGEGRFTCAGSNRLSEISRSPRDLVEQTGGEAHQYPDGYALFLGATAVPTTDRGATGAGFTHRVGDKVTIANVHLGTLINWVDVAESLPPWDCGIRALVHNLAARELLGSAR